MTWSIAIPIRSRDDSIADYRDVLREAPLDDDERRIAEAVADEALRSGATTQGEVLDYATEGGRPLLDRARATVGLDPTGDVDSRRDLAGAARGDLPPPPSQQRQSGPRRDRQGRAFMICGAPDCDVHPVDHAGAPTPIMAKKWWCPQHRHLAAEGDLSDWTEPAFRWTATGFERVLSPEDEAFYAEQQRQLREEVQARNERREAEAEVVAGARARWQRENDSSVDVMGFRPSQITVNSS